MSHRWSLGNRRILLLRQCHSSTLSFLNGGIFQAVTPTTPRVTIPPKITDRTVPSTFAATPDSNEPISFDEPMKIWFTAETLPSMCWGVRSVRRVDRITNRALSFTTLMSSSACDSQNDY